jgi:hypothetical protein
VLPILQLGHLGLLPNNKSYIIVCIAAQNEGIDEIRKNLLSFTISRHKWDTL